MLPTPPPHLGHRYISLGKASSGSRRPNGTAGRLYAGLQHLITVRRATPEFAGNALIGFDAKNPHIIGYQRPGPRGPVVCFVNVADDPQTIDPLTLSGLPGVMTDLLTEGLLTIRVTSDLW